MALDTMEIEVLADGTVKVTTSKISGANHINAEAFVVYLATLTGGEGTRERRADARGHVHDHDHAHAHDHVHTGGGKK
jgi:hypothetical protein